MYNFTGVYDDSMREQNLPKYTSRLLKELRKLSPKFITCYGKLMNPEMDRRGYTKDVLKDIAKVPSTPRRFSGWPWRMTGRRPPKPKDPTNWWGLVFSIGKAGISC